VFYYSWCQGRRKFFFKEGATNNNMFALFINSESERTLEHRERKHNLMFDRMSSYIYTRGSQPFQDLVPLGHLVFSTRTTSSRTTNLIES